MVSHIAHESVYDAAAISFAVVAAVFDIRERRIPNKLTGPAILTGLLLHLVLGGFAQLGWSLLAGLASGIAFLIFYLAGGLGAGDVKLMAALGCLVGISSIKDVLIASVLAGAVFAIALALYRGVLRRTVRNVVTLLRHHKQNGLSAHPEINVTNAETLRLPYAVPIAIGCMAAVGVQMFGGVTL